MVSSLPDRLPAQPKIHWQQKLGGAGLGGLAATTEYVVMGDRDLANQQDVFRCYLAESGLELWFVEYPAEGELDYGKSPRATPLIHGDLVFLLGAFGDLHCVELLTGEIVWRKNLREEFGVTAEMPWGYCGSPLLVDDQLIVTPGAAEASLAALNPRSGKVIWKTPGNPASYGSLLAGTFGGVKQIVGHDATSLGGWDARSGKRLWTWKPEVPGDFNVPTPLQVNDKLLVTTENNGARLFAFDNNGRIRPTPVASNARLHPSMTTPVVVGDRLVCVDTRAYCLDLRNGLKVNWLGRDQALSQYSSLIADSRRVLLTGKDELLLIDALQDRFEVISRVKLFHDGAELYSHPALVGDRLYVRGERTLLCVGLR